MYLIQQQDAEFDGFRNVVVYGKSTDGKMDKLTTQGLLRLDEDSFEINLFGNNGSTVLFNASIANDTTFTRNLCKVKGKDEHVVILVFEARAVVDEAVRSGKFYIHAPAASVDDLEGQLHRLVKEKRENVDELSLEASLCSPSSSKGSRDSLVGSPVAFKVEKVRLCCTFRLYFFTFTRNSHAFYFDWYPGQR